VLPSALGLGIPVNRGLAAAGQQAILRPAIDREMTTPLLIEAEEVTALPYCRFELQGRPSEGVLWDSRSQDILGEALHAIVAPPRRSDAHVNEDDLTQQLLEVPADEGILEDTAIFGGYLIRHFGHFCHESLGRLWWLGPEANMEQSAREASARLRQSGADVYFFMPRWLDTGKDLLNYMEAILASLGLAADRVRIMERPLRFRRLLVPAVLWGFNMEPQALDRQLGCDTRALMRNLLAGFQLKSDRGPLDPKEQQFSGDPSPAEKIYVTRSGLSLELGRLVGDVVLDGLLAQAGYRVLKPELLTIEQQLLHYSRAQDLVFMDGSALYVLWFAKLKQGARISVILRRRQGRWMCEKVQELLPDAAHVRWRILDAIHCEGLTSEKEWLSHNVVDLGAIVQQLTGQAATSLPESAGEALLDYSHHLVEQSTPEQLAQVLEGLISALVCRQPEAASRPRRLLRRLKRFIAKAPLRFQ
jgi:hypothetical protein